MTTSVAMATNRSYSKTKLAAADIVTPHIIFSLHQLFLPVRRYSENNKWIYCHKIKYQKFGQNSTKNSKKSKQKTSTVYKAM